MTILDRLLGRPEAIVHQPSASAVKASSMGQAASTDAFNDAIKATMGGGWLAAYQQGGINLSTLALEPQAKARALLQAYKIDWFNKAERKISTDFAGLAVSVAPEDAQGDNETAVVEPDLMAPWASLDPIGQFLRLMEKPNPYQTGRQLRQKTMIRLDMAGWAFWYTERGSDGLVVENGIYGISPSRLWPSYEDGTLIGYVLDRDSSNPATFDADEIIPFTYGTADDDMIYGVGCVEAIWQQVPLTDLMAKHTADLLATGGRLAGAMWPKERALDEAEFEDAKRAWRNVASDPNAGRRLLIFPEPMEWSQSASTPAEIGIPELAVLNRDDILTSFPLSPYQLGVPMPGGLNSAETRKEDRHDYWEGTIHPRVELFEETLQTYLVPRYENAVGYTLDFEVAEPNLDDAAALIEKAKAMDVLVSLGFDAKATVEAVKLDHIKWSPPPKPEPVVPPAPPEVPPAEVPPPPPPAKATKGARSERDDVLDPATARAQDRLTRFFDGQRARVEANIRAMPSNKAAREAYVRGTPYFAPLVKGDPYADAKATRNLSRYGRDLGDVGPLEERTFPAAVKTDPTWWDAAEEDELLTQTMRGIYADVGMGGLRTVSDTLGRTIVKGITRNVIADLLEYGGVRVKGINERTMQALSVELAEGTRRGYSIPQLIEGVPDEGFGGVKGVTLDNGTPAFGDLRAETIARTETMLSYNRATVTGYKEFGVTTLLAYDGDEDEACAERNGQEFSVAEAADIEDHPNGTLVWSPVVDKSWHEDRFYELAAKAIDRQPTEIHVHNAVTPPDVHVEMAPTTIDVAAAEVHVPPTVVNISTPDVAPPVVNVTLPDQVPPSVTVNVPSQKTPTVHVKADMPSEMRITSMPDRVTRRVVKRDAGLISETTEVETDG